MLLKGRARIASFDHHTPITGVVLFDDSDGIKRRIDFLALSLGLDARDVRATAVELHIGAGVPSASVWAMPSGAGHGEPDRERPDPKSR